MCPKRNKLHFIGSLRFQGDWQIGCVLDLDLHGIKARSLRGQRAV